MFRGESGLLRCFGGSRLSLVGGPRLLPRQLLYYLGSVGFWSEPIPVDRLDKRAELIEIYNRYEWLGGGHVRNQGLLFGVGSPSEACSEPGFQLASLRVGDRLRLEAREPFVFIWSLEALENLFGIESPVFGTESPSRARKLLRTCFGTESPVFGTESPLRAWKLFKSSEALENLLGTESPMFGTESPLRS
ncbi:hypothetical protein B296_00019198 [Ensete ventricosum]|uniref:Uncharacterized protein n=1 Tax=Ensete ventricosum TaxID=4639 RepID=A0A427AEH3_ENSVE|nr:hypothetical protein B296_00019198 [Ensete ventricosum]